ncbi:MAG: protein phosphatase 2C domain-containing protein [Halioglobus sp.]|nr:protein phosphatase 2C domain-containing protein [Halioglobus sp.]
MPDSAPGMCGPVCSGELCAHGMTDVGLERKNNEDAFLLLPLAAGRLLAAVADGVGGHRAGEVASKLTCETIAATAGRGLLDELDESPAIWSGVLSAMAHEAHRAIAALARENDGEYAGMACTLTLVLAGVSGFAYAQVGDSRLYRMADGSLRQLTRDQTVANALFEAGRIDKAQLAAHPDNKVLEQALGLQMAGNSLKIAHGEGELAAGNYLLLCSDGLSAAVPDTEIASILRSAHDLRAGSSALRAAALASGGRDNITTVLLRYGESGQ